MATRRLTKIEMAEADTREITDEALAAWIRSPKWEEIIAAVKAGDEHAVALALRAQEMFNAGAPVWDPATRKTRTSVTAHPTHKRESAQEKVMKKSDRKSTRLNSSHIQKSRMPSSA